MHKYRITYIDLQGVTTRVIVFAKTPDDAVQRILSLKLIINIRDLGKVIEPPEVLKNVFRLEKLSSRELADILRLLAYTKNAGLSIISSFESLSSAGSKKQILFCSNILDLVRKGSSLADAFQQYEYLLPIHVSSIIRSSSEAGTLSEVLLSLSDQLESNVAVSNKVRTAMIYPAIVLIIAIAVTIFLFTGIIPEVASVLKNLGDAELPTATQIIINTGKFLQQYGLILLGGLVGIIIVVRLAFHKQLMTFKAKFAAKFPFISKVVVSGEMAKFYSHLGFLLKAGFPVDAAVSSAINVMNNAYLKQCLGNSLAAVQHGNNIAEALRISHIVSDVHLQLLYTGSASGRLIEICETLSQQLIDETNRSISRLLKIIEPVIMLIVGGIVGIVMVAVYQPLFEMMTVI